MRARASATVAVFGALTLCCANQAAVGEPRSLCCANQAAVGEPRSLGCPESKRMPPGAPADPFAQIRKWVDSLPPGSTDSDALKVTRSAKGISVSGSGVAVGLLLRRLSEAHPSKEPLLLRGSVALRPVWIHVTNGRADQIEEAALRASALVPGEDVRPGGARVAYDELGGTPFDGIAASEVQAHLEAEEHAVFSARGSEQLAEAIAQLLMTRWGAVSSAPSRGSITVRDIYSNVHRIGRFVEWLEGDGDALMVSRSAGERAGLTLAITRGGKRATTCPLRGDPYPLAPVGPTIYNEVSAGAHIVRNARQKGEQVVVGLGGHLPLVATTASSTTATLRRRAFGMEFSSVGAISVARSWWIKDWTDCMEHSREALDIRTTGVVAFRAGEAHELAEAIEAAELGTTAVLPSHSALVVALYRERLPELKDLLLRLEPSLAAALADLQSWNAAP